MAFGLSGDDRKSKMVGGDVMLIESHVDFMNRTSSAMASPPVLGRPSLRSDTAYDRELMEIAKRIARDNGFALHEGVYAAMLGPNYETRAEYRMLRRLGADVVGMSTVHETIAAQQSPELMQRGLGGALQEALVFRDAAGGGIDGAHCSRILGSATA